MDRIYNIYDNYIVCDGVQSLYNHSKYELTTESKDENGEVNIKTTEEKFFKVLTMMNYLYNKTTTTVNECETWEYKRGSKFFLFTKIIENNEETKTYSVQPSSKELRTKFRNKMKNTINNSFNGPQRDVYIDETIELIKRDRDDEEFNAKFSSSGRGKLSVNAYKESTETKDGIISSLEESYYYDWKKYSLKKMNTEVTEKKENESNGNYTKVTTGKYFYFKTFVYPSYPKKKQFQKI